MTKSLLRKICFALAVLVVSSVQNVSSQSSKSTTTTTTTKSPSKGPIVSRYGLAVPAQLETANQIAAYIQKVLDLKIPGGYEYPTYIRQAATYEDALTELGKRYPQFHEKGGNELYAAISKAPLLYQDVIIENRVIREVFPHGVNTDNTNH